MRRLLVIDPNVTSGSPSIRCWLAAAGAYLGKFDEIEVWAHRCELTGGNVSFVPVPEHSFLGPFAGIHYIRTVRRRLGDLSASRLSETLVQCTGWIVPKADVRIIQFWDTAYMKLIRSGRRDLRMSLKQRIFGGMAIRAENAIIQPGATGAWWCVSRGIAEPIVESDQSGAVMRYLPNSYDDLRFNHDARALWRAGMRAHYGFSEEETVFCFSSFGHFERKGLRQAAQAVTRLAREGLKVKLLVIGGSASLIKRYRRELSTAGVDLELLRFTGLVSQMEKHMSAAEAFLFPSHFEAFSLAEIEAGALGLKLYLTAHPGHEMILREHVNGRLLPWDVEGMTRVLGEEIRSGAVRASHHEIGEALNPAEYQSRLAGLFEDAILRKWPVTSTSD